MTTDPTNCGYSGSSQEIKADSDDVPVNRTHQQSITFRILENPQENPTQDQTQILTCPPAGCTCRRDSTGEGGANTILGTTALH